MPPSISNNADIHPRARLDEDVEIGPFCVVGPDVQLGRGTRLLAHVTLLGQVTLGEFNTLYPGVVIGGPPDGAGGDAAAGAVRIGDRTVIRESATISGGSGPDGGPTRLGSRCSLQPGCHVAEQCLLGDRVVLGPAAILGNGVRVHDFATVAEGAQVHPRATLGRSSLVAGLSRVVHDVPPYLLAEGNPARIRGVNIVGLQRQHVPNEDIQALMEAQRLIYRSKCGLDEAWQTLRHAGQLIPCVNQLLQFIQEQQEGRSGRARDKRLAA